jgi:hypothetical protein
VLLLECIHRADIFEQRSVRRLVLLVDQLHLLEQRLDRLVVVADLRIRNTKVAERFQNFGVCLSVCVWARAGVRVCGFVWVGVREREQARARARARVPHLAPPVPVQRSPREIGPSCSAAL